MISSGGPRNSTPGTLNQLFFEAVRKHDAPDALQVKIGGSYRPIAHRDVEKRVRWIALGLQELGFREADRVAILSENRPEWALADYGALTSRITDVPLYPNLPAEQAAYILRDSGCSAIFVSSSDQAGKIASIRRECPELRCVVGFGSVRDAGVDLTLGQLEARGQAVDSPERAQAYREAALSLSPEFVATIIYTSGTTGEPKGVMLTHDNLYSNVVAAAVAVPFAGKDVALSFLPLSHIFERMAGHYLMFHTGTSIAYAESIDTVPDDLLAVRPTLVLSVPRLYEKMYARVLETALAGGVVKKRIFLWAREVADHWANERLAGTEPGGLLAVQYRIAQRLVFSKLKARTGGRLRYFVSGGAPLAADINKFFYAAGLVVLEGYGLTETSPVISVNRPDAFRIGTVGKPIPGVEVQTAIDGEILTRGPHVMKGYYGQPQATAEAIDAQGWFHTGDIGVIEDGFLAITDRKKDIIVTAGGKNIAPQPIENRVKANSFVSQAVVVGDRRKFPSLLVVPEWNALEKWAREQGIVWTDRADLLANRAVHVKMEAEALGELHGLARFEMPKKVALLEHDFSVERGELTPTLKVKRRVIDRTYKDLIDDLYAEQAPGPAGEVHGG